MRQICFLVLLALLAPIAGCGARTSSADQSLIDQANSLHRAFSLATVEDPPLRAYLQQVSTRLVTAAKAVAGEQSLSKPGDDTEWMYSRDIQFHIAKSTIPNAFTSGGNHIYVLLPALQRCEGEDELAAAFAHAYAHTLLRHLEHNIHALPADAPAASIVLRFVEHKFNLKQEQQADELAFMIHVRGGWDPLAFEAMLRHMETPAARLAAIQSRIERLPPAAQEWSRPPIADGRRFGLHREHAGTLANQKQIAAVVERLVRAMPNCFLPDDLPQQREAQRDLITPISTDTPNTFEKGPRERRQ